MKLKQVQIMAQEQPEHDWELVWTDGYEAVYECKNCGVDLADVGPDDPCLKPDGLAEMEERERRDTD